MKRLERRSFDRGPDDPPEPWLKPEHMVGGAEIRRMAGGITRHTLLAWRRDTFPKPVAALEIGEVWDIRAVHDWMRRRH